MTPSDAKIIVLTSLGFFLALGCGLVAMRRGETVEIEDPNSLHCARNMRRIERALYRYMVRHREEYPVADGLRFLSVLYEEGHTEDLSIFICPLGDQEVAATLPLDRSNCSYLARRNAGPHRLRSVPRTGYMPESTAILACRHHPDGVRVLVARSYIVTVSVEAFEERDARVLE